MLLWSTIGQNFPLLSLDVVLPQRKLSTLISLDRLAILFSCDY